VRILVLGGGAQGRVIASDLDRSLPWNHIRVADVRDPGLSGPANLSWVEANLEDTEATARLLAEHDLGVGALPSRLGFGAMQAAIEARRNLVDVSFSAEDPLTLDARAKRAGITIAPDCGLAPGLSNLLVGHAVATHGTPRELMIYVGGVAEDSSRPYGYVVTWSLADLVEEYTRPARIVEDREVVTVPVFSGHESIHIDGVGEMEAFYSDGLRSLLETIPDVSRMGEKTLRWPGHSRAVQPLVAQGRLIEEFTAHCVADPPRDLVAFLVRLRWDKRSEEVTMVDRYDPVSGLTAMSRTTAFTTSVVAQLAAEGGLREPGVRPLELVARDPAAHRFVVEAMARRGVRLDSREVPLTAIP
jgi:lysine 6-dehydrogenase